MPPLCIFTGRPAEAVATYYVRKELRGPWYRMYKIRVPMTKRSKLMHWWIPRLSLPASAAIATALFFVGKQHAEADGAFSPYGRQLMWGAGGLCAVCVLGFLYSARRLRFPEFKST